MFAISAIILARLRQRLWGGEVVETVTGNQTVSLSELPK